MYNIGGVGSTRSVVWSPLSSKTPHIWKFMDVPNYHFEREYYVREALVVENKIVYFGYWNKNATFVLKQEEKSEKLKVVRKD